MAPGLSEAAGNVGTAVELAAAAIEPVMNGTFRMLPHSLRRLPHGQPE